MVDDVCLLPKAGQKHPIPLPFPPHVQIEDNAIMPHMEKLQKLFLWWGLPHTSLLCMLMMLLVDLLATTLADQHITTVLPKFLRFRRCQNSKALSHTLQGWPFSLSFALYIHTDPIQQQHEFPHKPALNTCRTSCQQMSTLLHVLLKADPCLEGDVADRKAGSFLFH